MSSTHKAMPGLASQVLSRRAFSKRSILALAGAAGITGISNLSAQEVTNETATVVAKDTSMQASEATTASTGQYISTFALQFVGYPYVWGGNTPGGFDCSGFTQYVILNTLGIDIGHGTAGQTGFGRYIDAANILPGDLVYFAGTYDAGISHAGVYIGDGQFVHAEQPATGVTVSWLWSDYYAAHYWGAIRLW